MTGRFDVTAALLCEDVRDELGERTSLMGVLAPTLGFEEFPARRKIQVVLIGNVVEAGDLGLKVELFFRGEAKWGVELKAELAGVGESALIPLSPTIAIFDEPGTLSLDVEMNGERRRVQNWQVEGEDDD